MNLYAADSLGCATQTVRNAIRAFQAAGIDRLNRRSHRPASAHPEPDGIACERLRALLHRSPRDLARLTFGSPSRKDRENTYPATIAPHPELFSAQNRSGRAPRACALRVRTHLEVARPSPEEQRGT